MKGKRRVTETKVRTMTETKLERIAALSRENPRMEFIGLMPHVNEGFLIRCFHLLDGKKAVGVDRKTKEEYGKNLLPNIRDLLRRMKSMSYRPLPVKEVLIPKGDGRMRPLGISTIEDKLVQMAFSKILEAIYEPIFRKCSYGFRRGISCHDAVEACNKHLYRGRTRVVIDVDLENYFGTIDHKKLVKLLEMKIKDKRFIRYIVRMLKSGVLSKGELKRTDEGTPQGSICSPILANIFAHYALDEWFNHEVKRHTKGEVEIFRYCDDFVVCCELKEDAAKITRALNGRMERFGLKLNTEKTKQVAFSRSEMYKGRKQGSFDFLGFTFYWGRTRSGHFVPKLKTSKKRLKAKLKAVTDWCRKSRHKARMPILWEVLCSKLAGHIRYYGVSFNSRSLGIFVTEAIRTFYKWVNRRGQRRSHNWDSFKKFQKSKPPPKTKIYHSMF